MHITSTHHVAIYTSNFERLRDFYVNTLGLPLRGAFDGYDIIFVDAGTTTIEIVEDKSRGDDRTEGGWRHLALEVADVDDAFEELTALGIRFHVPPENFPPGEPLMRIAFFRDPDGNEIELLQPLVRKYP
ncbi:MAG TPA: VOC family protein [Chloroflexota bacterium]|nr:VOC family protein [Chloroflexota bacterium]